MAELRALVEAAEIHELLAAGRAPALLDVRWRLNAPSMRDDYRRGHLPGAHFVELNTDLAGPPGAGRHPLPGTEVFGAAMRRAGVSQERPVVAYDMADSVAAARCWWLLAYHGHPDVRVLNGGLLAWLRAGYELSSDDVADAGGDFVPTPGSLRLLDADGAAATVARGLLLDARSAERYRGDAEPIDPVAGHIPGARSAPTTENLRADGRFLDPGELHRRFRGLGVAAGDDIGVYCGSGITAAHEVLALSLAGIDAGLYAGSWSDWITDARRPVTIGDGDDSG